MRLDGAAQHPAPDTDELMRHAVAPVEAPGGEQIGEPVEMVIVEAILGPQERGQDIEAETGDRRIVGEKQ
jgi:hypothetical protein